MLVVRLLGKLSESGNVRVVIARTTPETFELYVAAEMNANNAALGSHWKPASVVCSLVPRPGARRWDPQS